MSTEITPPGIKAQITPAPGLVPTTADYLVGTANAGLSNEIAVGTTPGGELGNTWASPTVDASHSGSTHAAAQAAAEATAAGALATHDADATSVHGIANTANLYAAGGTDVAVADGGTGASTAAGARANLDLEAGTDFPSQAAFDDHSARHENGGADEISIAGLDGTSVELAAHLADAADAHDASAISVSPVVGGASNVQTALQAVSLGWYNVLAYGAVGDGVANDAAAIQAAIDACATAGGGTVYFPGGTYLALSLALKTNVRLLGNGGAILKKNGGGSGTLIVEATGTLGTAVALNASPALGAQLVTAATNPATLVAGDYVLIRDATYQYATSGRNQEINRIISVTGSYTFNLANRLGSSYATASSAEIIKLSAIVDATIENLTLTVPVGTDGGCARATLTTGFLVRVCLISGMNQLPGVTINESTNAQILSNDVRDGQDTATFGYGLLVGESSHDVIVRGNHVENVRECLNTNNARDVIWDANVIRQVVDSGIGTHGSGNHRVTITNNIISGSSQYGIIAGGSLASDTDVLISNNFIYNCGATSILVKGNTSGAATRRVSVLGNYVYGQAASTYMLMVNNFATDVLVAGNVCDQSLGGALTALMLVNGDTAADVSNVRVTNNVFRNVTGKGIRVGNSTRCVISENSFAGISSSNIESLTGNIQLRVTNNVADDTTFTETAGELWRDNVWGTTIQARIAADVTFTPTGSIVATDVQAAIAEVALEGVDIQIFTATGAGTWTKPTAFTPKNVRAILYAAGGGGGGGSSNTGAVVRCGGAGGGGGARLDRLYNASDLAATEAISVGTGGTAGAAGASGADGGNGGVGGNTTFSTGTKLATSFGGGGGVGGDNAATAGSGGGGGGVLEAGATGSTAVATGGRPGASATPSGGQGGNSLNSANAQQTAEYGGGPGGGHTNVPANSTGGSSLFGGAGGGVGGGATVTPANISPTAGGGHVLAAGTGGAAGASGAVPTVGTAGVVGVLHVGGTGGGGGGGTITTNVAGVAGGAGGGHGGGGGGGGVGEGTATGGIGGVGGDGALYVVSW